MSTIIKATEQNRDVQRVAFNFDDMAAKADQFLEKVRAEATRILTKAQQEAQVLRNRAEAEGRKAAQATVEKMVEKQLAQQLSTLLPALRQATQEIQHAKQAWLTHWEKNAVHLAGAMAARLVRREAIAHPEVTVTLVREALELATGSSQVRIHLNPADHATLGAQVKTLVKELAPLGATEVVADPQISAGGCRVETQFGAIDQQFEAQLARIEEELT
jgi:flagellar assembly protein FliH